MLQIDTTKMLIEITRGDTASIVFSAKDGSGNTWNPSSTESTLTFSVSKKWGSEPLMEIINTYDGSSTSDYWTIKIEKEHWLDESGNDIFKFSDYVWDVQVTTPDFNNTIIGKTDTLEPKFRVWGESAKE